MKAINSGAFNSHARNRLTDHTVDSPCEGKK
jgi:hypothetical protein